MKALLHIGANIHCLAWMALRVSPGMPQVGQGGCQGVSKLRSIVHMMVRLQGVRSIHSIYGDHVGVRIVIPRWDVL
jgi:hypothetical protein